jgi:hypothetical protein
MPQLEEAGPPSTLKGYNGAVVQFLEFCDKEKVPVKCMFPTGETVLCAFAASRLGQQAGSTIRNQLAGLKFGTPCGIQ